MLDSRHQLLLHKQKVASRAVTEITIAATSKVSKDLFTKHEVQLLQKGFTNLIKKRSVTESVVQLAISTHSAAKIIGAKFKLSTIKNRLKYEIC